MTTEEAVVKITDSKNNVYFSSLWKLDGDHLCKAETHQKINKNFWRRVYSSNALASLKGKVTKW